MKFLFPLVFVLIFPAGAIFALEDGNNENITFPPNAIINAAYVGDVELVKQILSSNPDTDVRDSLGGTALHVAIFRNNLEVMKLLIDYGFDINAAASSNGYTPLHYCVWTNNAEAARLLVSLKANRNIKAKDGRTPAQKAAKEGKRDILLLLSRK